jgi:hypothetical protein
MANWSDGLWFGQPVWLVVLGHGVGRTQIQTRSQDQNMVFKNVNMLSTFSPRAPG